MKKYFLRRLQEKILIFIMPTTLIPIMIIGWVAYERLRKSSIDNMLLQMEVLANQIDLHVNNTIKTAKSNADLFSRSQLIEQYLFADEQNRYTLLQPALLELFSSYHKAYPDYQEIRIILPDGYEDARFVANNIPNFTEEEGGQAYFSEIMKSPNLDNAYLYYNSDDKQYGILVSRKIYLRNRVMESVHTPAVLRGILTITVSNQFLHHLISQNRIGKEGYIFFTDGSGKVLFSPLDRPNMQLPAEFSRSLNHYASHKAKFGEMSLEGEDFYSYSKKIFDNLMLFTVLPKKEIMAESEYLAWLVTGLTIVAALVVSILMFAFLSFMIIAPIKQLSRATKEVEKGNFNISLQSGFRDEIGELTKSFNIMANRLGNVNRFLESEVEKRTLQLADKNRELAHTNEENKSLVRILCHDLNNALAIINATSLIVLESGSKLDEKMQKYWQRVYRAALVQKEIIEYVREMEALTSGKMELKLEPVCLREVLENAQFIFKEKLENKNLQLDFYEKELEDIYILAEKITVSNNVINNLISNAIKFSLEGTRIVCRVSVDDQLVNLAIIDQGIGIPQDILLNLFNTSKKTSRPGTAGERGTGFGMPLVKTFMTYYGAEINIESRETNEYPQDHGTTVYLVFKRALNPSKKGSNQGLFAA